MTRKIIDTSTTYPRIRDTSPTMPRVDPAQVAAALGAEPTGVTRDDGGSPLSIFLLRAELFRRLQLSSGSPVLEAVPCRAKIPISEPDWKRLEELAASLAENGFTPSAGQVASVLLSLSLRSLPERDPQAVRDALREQAASKAQSS
jgi:hypothetical protein